MFGRRCNFGLFVLTLFQTFLLKRVVILTLKKPYTVADADTIAPQIVALINSPQSRGLVKERTIQNKEMQEQPKWYLRLLGLLKKGDDSLVNQNPQTNCSQVVGERRKQLSRKIICKSEMWM